MGIRSWDVKAFRIAAAIAAALFVILSSAPPAEAQIANQTVYFAPTATYPVSGSTFRAGTQGTFGSAITTEYEFRSGWEDYASVWISTTRTDAVITLVGRYFCLSERGNSIRKRTVPSSHLVNASALTINGIQGRRYTYSKPTGSTMCQNPDPNRGAGVPYLTDGTHFSWRATVTLPALPPAPTAPTVRITTPMQTVGGGGGVKVVASTTGTVSTLRWTATGGTFSSTTAQTTTWAAPAAQNNAITYRLRATVTGAGSTVWAEVAMTVSALAPPTVRITTEPRTVDGGETVGVTAMTTGTVSSIQWTETGGVFASTTTLATFWVAPDAEDAEETYTLTVTVTGASRTVTARVEMTVNPTPPAFETLEVNEVRAFKNVLRAEDILIIARYTANDRAPSNAVTSNEAVVYVRDGTSIGGLKALPLVTNDPDGGESRLAAFYRVSDADLVPFGTNGAEVCVDMNPTTTVTGPDDLPGCVNIRWHPSASVEENAVILREEFIAVFHNINNDYTTRGRIENTDEENGGLIKLITESMWPSIYDVIPTAFETAVRSIQPTEFTTVAGTSTPLTNKLTYDAFISPGTEVTLSRPSVDNGDGTHIAAIYVVSDSGESVAYGFTDTAERTLTGFPQTTAAVIYYYTTSPSTMTTTVDARTDSSGVVDLSEHDGRPMIALTEDSTVQGLVVRDSAGQVLTGVGFMPPYTLSGLPADTNVTIRYKTAVQRSFWNQLQGGAKTWGLGDVALLIVVFIVLVGLFAWYNRTKGGDGRVLYFLPFNALFIMGLAGAMAIEFLFAVISVTILLGFRTLFDGRS